MTKGEHIGHVRELPRGDMIVHKSNTIVIMTHTFGSIKRAEEKQRWMCLRKGSKVERTGTKKKYILVLSEQGESKNSIQMT